MLRRDAFLAKTEKVTLDLGVHHQQTVKTYIVENYTRFTYFKVGSCE